MFSGMRRDRSFDCISDLRFDRWRAGVLTEAEEGELNEHLAGCDRCRERQALLAGAAAGFDASLPEWLNGSGVHPKPPLSWRGRAFALASLVAAAACALLMLRLQSPAEGLRTKGNPFVTYYVKRGDEVVRGANAQVLQPADRVRFAYSTTRKQYLAILSLDATAHASVYFPAAPQAASIEPGTDVLLPSAIELDATLGQELIVAVFCERPFNVAPLREALASGLRVPEGCTSQQLQLTKKSGAR